MQDWLPIIAAVIGALAAFGVWALVFWASRYVSLASIVAAAALSVFALAMQCLGHGRGWPYAGFAVFASLLVIVRHKGNIQRLLAGTENRFGKKKEASP